MHIVHHTSHNNIILVPCKIENTHTIGNFCWAWRGHIRWSRIACFMFLHALNKNKLRDFAAHRMLHVFARFNKNKLRDFHTSSQMKPIALCMLHVFARFNILNKNKLRNFHTHIIANITSCNCIFQLQNEFFGALRVRYVRSSSLFCDKTTRATT